MQERENDLEFMRNNLEQDMKEQIDIIQSLEEGMQKEEMDYQNEMKIKLNEKELELKEENKKKLKERLDKVRDNLQFEMSLKEKNHKSQMERKIDEVATLEESLLRAVARKNEVEEKLRAFNEDSTQALLSRIGEGSGKRGEQFGSHYDIYGLRSMFNMDSGRLNVDYPRIQYCPHCAYYQELAYFYYYVAHIF